MTSTPHRAFDRWTSHPPPVWLLLITALLVGEITYLRSAPYPQWGGPPPVMCIIWPVAVLILVDYAVRLVGSLALRRFTPRNLRWYVTPALALLVLWASTTDYLLHVRFERSRRAFEAAAAELLSGKPSAEESLADMHNDNGWLEFDHYSKRVGTYEVNRVSVFPNERLVFFMTNGVFRSGWGFLYNPLGQNAEIRDVYARPLGDGWYTFTFSKP